MNIYSTIGWYSLRYIVAVFQASFFGVRAWRRVCRWWCVVDDGDGDGDGGIDNGDGDGDGVDDNDDDHADDDHVDAP